MHFCAIDVGSVETSSVRSAVCLPAFNFLLFDGGALPLEALCVSMVAPRAPTEVAVYPSINSLFGSASLSLFVVPPFSKRSGGYRDPMAFDFKRVALQIALVFAHNASSSRSTHSKRT